MSPDEVAELSRLLDKALLLEPAARESWLVEFGRSRPDTVRHLRDMLAQTQVPDTGFLPKLPKVEVDEAVASAGDRVGPYQLIKEIGRGGMGSVWLAERADGAFKRKVALKLPRLTWAAGLAKRMARERDIGALLEHPNIARLYDAGVDEHGRPYIAYEYIDGVPLDVYCRQHALDPRAKLKLFLHVVRAVAFAHSRLVLHRDIKPGNVLVDTEGNVHLLDFGIAKLLDDTASDLTQEQGRLMTVSYAAPEQILGQSLGVAADIYALGMVLYELLAGALPYASTRKSAGAMEEAILAGNPPLASHRVADRRGVRELRGDLDAIVGKAIKRDADQRYPTADALAADLQRYLDGRSIEARPDGVWYRLRKAIARHRVPVAAVSAVIIALAIGGAAALILAQRASREAERTQLATAFVSELFRVNAGSRDPGGDGSAPSAFVDRGAELIEARFRDQPALQAKLYGAVSHVYVDLGVGRLATRYARRQLESLRAQQASRAEIARAEILAIESAMADERFVDAENFIRQTLQTLEPNSDVRPELLALLARAQLANGAQTEEIVSVVEEGKRLLERDGQTNSISGAWFAFEEGNLLSRTRNPAWQPTVEAAIAQALTVEGSPSAAANQMRLWFASALITMERGEEGRKVGQIAIDGYEAMGGTGRIRAALARAKLAHMLVWEDVLLYPDVAPTFDAAISVLRMYSGVLPPEVLADVVQKKACAQSEWGEPVAASETLRWSSDVVERWTQDWRRRAELAHCEAHNARDLGHHREAEQHFRQIMDIRNKTGRGAHPYAAGTWGNLAENLAMEGRGQEALALLRSAPAFGTIPGELNAGDFVIAKGRLIAGLAAGDLVEAQRGESAYPPSKSDDFAYRGELKCAVGRADEGFGQLRAAIEALSKEQSPISPHLARFRAVAGNCALSLGHRAEAKQFAEAARSAFEVQPGVSAYFMKPLAELERRLADSQPTSAGARRPRQVSPAAPSADQPPLKSVQSGPQ